jgi:hypothetical protein
MAAGAILPPLFFGRSLAFLSILAPATGTRGNVPKHWQRRSRLMKRPARSSAIEKQAITAEGI